jgi:hypothetical protein
MKKIILTLAFASITSVTFSQTTIASKINAASSKANTTANNKITGATTTASNYLSQAKSVSSTLNTALALTSVQKPKVANIVTDYLKNKASISSLANTNASAYTSKLSTLNSGMLSKMKTTLTAVQYAKLLGLKTSPATDVIANLFSN